MYLLSFLCLTSASGIILEDAKSTAGALTAPALRINRSLLPDLGPPSVITRVSILQPPENPAVPRVTAPPQPLDLPPKVSVREAPVSLAKILRSAFAALDATDPVAPDLPPVVPYGEPAAACNPCCKNRHIFGEALYWRVRNGNIPFAEPRDGVTDVAVPVGPVAVVEPDYSVGFRAGMAHRLDNSTFLEGSFTWYRTESNAVAGIPPGAPGTSVLRSLVTHPNTLDAAADSVTATGRVELDYYVGDLDWKASLLSGPRFMIGYRLGGRYAHLQQDFLGVFNINGMTTVTTDITFDGGGPRAALEAEYHYARGLYTYGRGAISLLAGHFRASYLQENIIAGVQATAGIEESRIVPVTDLEFGLGWQCLGGRLRCSIGYTLVTWHNAVTTSAFIDSVRNTDYARGDSLKDILSIEGAVGRIEYRW